MMTTWNDRLSAVMTEKGISDAAMGRHCNEVTGPTIRKWRSGETTSLAMDQVYRAAELLGVSPEWLYFGKGERLRPKTELVTIPCLNDDLSITLPPSEVEPSTVLYRLNDLSFAPKLWDRDLLFFNTAQSELLNSRIFLFRDKTVKSNEYFVRRYFYENASRMHALTTGFDNKGLSLDADRFKELMTTVEVIGLYYQRVTRDS